MPQSFCIRTCTHAVFIPMIALLLVACGGGSSGGTSGIADMAPVVAPVPVTTAPVTISEPDAPRVTNNTATDGFNWINYRRQQAGIQALTRNAFVDSAAQGHSEYQKINNTISHTQTVGKPGFTGATLADRLIAAGYLFKFSSYAFGEVISGTSDTSGANAAEDLITAIYHRFVLFEPMFKEAGTGAATIPGNYTYFTADLVSDNLDKGIAKGQLVSYPFDAQKNVLMKFNSDNESPDPVPNKNTVGFPVSVHANVTSVLKVLSFTITPRGGAALTTLMLAAATDRHTPGSAAAIIPLDELATGKTYDVRFIGSLDGVPVDRAWSFTTR
jgi:uncharacterized protein YkwD